MKRPFDFKDKAILTGWIIGLLVFISLMWVLSQPLQSYYLLRTVNSMFINSDDPRRITAGTNQGRDKTSLLGYWYNMYNSTDKMFVFSVFQDGILIPLGAIVKDNGTVDEIIPLSLHAMQIFSSLPQSILDIYITRIEAAFVHNSKINIEGSYR